VGEPRARGDAKTKLVEKGRFFLKTPLLLAKSFTLDKALPCNLAEGSVKDAGFPPLFWKPGFRHIRLPDKRLPGEGRGQG